MEGREAMSFPGGHPPPPFYFPRGAFTSISSPQSANVLHAPPGFRPMLNPNLQQQQQQLHHPHLSNSGHHPFPFGEQQRHQDFTHGIHMGIASSPTIQPPPPPLPPSPVAETEMVVKKKRGRPKKDVAQVSLGLSPTPSSNKPKKSSSSMSDPNASKRAGRGRPPGTGRKQRLANLGEWMNTSAGHAFTPHVISVEAGEDIVSKVLLFSQQRPRVLCIMSGTGTVSKVTLCQSTSSHILSYQEHCEILSLGGSYLVNEEGGPKSRSGGISVSLSCPDGRLLGGRVETLIAASLVQVVACSFVYGSAKAKTIKQENGSKQEKNKMETPSSEPEEPSPAAAAETESAGEAEAEAAQRPPEFSSPAMTTGWSGSVGESRSTDSRNNNHDIDLTRG